MQGLVFSTNLLKIRCGVLHEALGERKRPVHPVLPDVKDLLTKFVTFAEAFHGSRRHFDLQFEVKRVEKVRLCLKIGKERTVRYVSLFR